MRGELEVFGELAALIDAGGENAIEEAHALLGQFKDSSEHVSEAIDDFMLDLMTLVFLAETGKGTSYVAAQRLAHKRLLKLKLLLS